MTEKTQRFLPTRQSLLGRLKRWDDQESWREFFNIYWGLLYRTARKSGLNDSEAQDVVQDTIITVAKKMESFRYDPAVDSFKGWLLYLTRKRIALEYRRRSRAGYKADPPTGAIEKISGPAGFDLETVWEEEWAKTMWDQAYGQVKEQVALKQLQMFDLYVVKERPAVEVAQSLGVTVAQVYLAKHRISALIKQNVLELRKKFG